MLPMEFKIDKNGLFYFDNENLLNSLYPFYNNKNLFFHLEGIDNYLVKYSSKEYTKKEILKYKQMLLFFQKLQPQFKEIDFPIGYYKEANELRGIIIPYYHGPTLRKVSEERELGDLSKYYYQDDDMIHNLFCLYLDILDQMEHLFAEKIYYVDVHSGNFVLDNNQVKLIDFEIPYIHFNQKARESLTTIINNYIYLVKITNRRFGIHDDLLFTEGNFSETRFLVKSLENRVRKEYHNGIWKRKVINWW